MSRVILDLCGGTGSWSKPYKEAGYKVVVVTLPDYDIRGTFMDLNTVVFKGMHGAKDIEVKAHEVFGVFAAPPCTMFSRARTTAKTPRDFEGAMKIVQACLNVIWFIQFQSPYTLQFWALENPAGHLKRFLGNPPFKFHPYEFGDPHSKQTFIWGNFNEPKKSPIKLTDEQILQSRNNTRPLPVIPNDYKKDVSMKTIQIRRSITPQGFAQAFYKANK